jgi:hypothetical protein
MKRHGLAALRLTAIAVAVAVPLASCGSAVSSLQSGTSAGAGTGAAQHGLTVDPRTGNPLTTFTLRFIAPAATRRIGHSRFGYVLSLTSVGGPGCLAARSIAVAAARRGELIPVTLDPRRLGGIWCLGSYTARVVEVETPVCAPGNMCPQFVRVVGTVGSTTFRVVRAG